MVGTSALCIKRTADFRAKRKFCVSCSYGGLILCVIDCLSIAELDAFDDLAEAVGSVQAAPVTLSRFDQLGDHSEPGVADSQPLALSGRSRTAILNKSLNDRKWHSFIGGLVSEIGRLPTVPSEFPADEVGFGRKARNQ